MQDTAKPTETVRKSNWGIGMAVLYCSFAIFILALVVFSVSNPVDLVEDNYYEQELLYQDQVNRIRRTKALPVGLRVHYTAVRHQITVSFPTQFSESTEGTITLFRPSDSRLDHVIDLKLNDNAEQVIDSELMTPGMWRLIVRWTSDGQEYYDEEILVLK